jgi:ATP-dependent exoDNAse (exonuclease V) beta subunit
MTRARDLIVLSGAGTNRPSGWRKLADSFLNNESSGILRQRRFSEITSTEKKILEVAEQIPEIQFTPLAIPVGLERKPVTDLLECSECKNTEPTVSFDRKAIGTLGHLVLEELAKNRWVGSIEELIQRFSSTTGSVNTERLIRQLEVSRGVLYQQTEEAEALFTEHSFVLKQDNLILDGTIDLLAKVPAGWKVLDYKFSDESPETVIETYAPQLTVYREAVKQMHPGDTVSAALVLISDTVSVIQMDEVV